MHYLLVCCTFCGLSTLLISYYIITIIVLGDGIPPQAGDIPDFYWGPHDPHRKKADDEKWEQISITVGNISVSELHTKLREELSSGRVVASLENSGFKYGFQSKFLSTVVDHWTSKYNWAKRQEWLNSVPHFRMKISGLSIHFRYMRAPKVAKGKEVIPILLIHGWPGSFVEFQNVMPSLANPREGDVYFEVVAPSIPGFAFSEAASKEGLGPVEVAQIFLKLMIRLGNTEFYVHGSGWGSLVATAMAILYPQNVLGLHSTFCVSDHPRSFFKLAVSAMLHWNSGGYTAQSLASFAAEAGSIHIQATKPDAVGMGLALSPTALTSYLLGKFSSWSNSTAAWTEQDGGLLNKFRLDELLDNVMIYWVSHSAATSIRFFTNAFSKQQRSYGLQRVPVKVPTACLVPSGDPFQMQRKSVVKDKYANLIQYGVLHGVGHFVSFEQPETLAKDINVFVKKLGIKPSSSAKAEDKKKKPTGKERKDEL